MDTKRGTWSFTFRLPDGYMPHVGGKPSATHDNAIYSTSAVSSTRQAAEQIARASVAKRGRVDASSLRLTGWTAEDTTAKAIDDGEAQS